MNLLKLSRPSLGPRSRPIWAKFGASTEPPKFAEQRVADPFFFGRLMSLKRGADPTQIRG